MSKQPNVLGLEDFLATLSLESPPNLKDYDSEIIAPGMRAAGVDENRQAINDLTPEVKLWHKTGDASFTIGSLISIVESYLKKHQHLSNRQLALAVIGLYLVLRQPTGSYSEDFFEIFQNTVESSVTLFYIFPRFLSTGKSLKLSPFQFGPYSFDKLQLTHFKKLCRKAKSDFFDRYESRLSNRYAIQREISKVVVINWWPYREKRSIALSNIPTIRNQYNELTENYFDKLHEALFDQFFEEIYQEQCLTIVAGNTYLPEKELQRLHSTDRIAIFQNIDGRHENGFVKPLAVDHIGTIDFASVDTRIPKALSYLKNEFNLVNLTDREVHITLRNFAEFVSKAKRDRWSGHYDEAFLHFIIALDLTFGDEDESAKSVSRRVAVITYQSVNSSYSDQETRIKKLYKARSKYVHEGKSVSQSSLDEAEMICGEIFKCLLRLQKDETKRSTIKIEQWLKDIDLIAASLDANKMPASELFSACGISQETQN